MPTTASEYINHQVGGRLEKLRIELTESRPRHSNDNGLAETKTAPWCASASATAIPVPLCNTINAFCAAYLNPCLNFHRPCLFAEDTIES